MRSLRTRLAVTLVAARGAHRRRDRRRRLRVRRRLAARPARRRRPPAGRLQPVGPAAGDDPAAGRRGRRSRRAACPSSSGCAATPRSIADFGDGDPYAPARLPGALGRRLARRCATIVGGGRARLRVADARRRAGARRRRAPGRPARRSTSCSRRRAVEDALAQLRLGLLAGGLLAILARARHVRAHRPRHPPAGRRRRRGPRGGSRTATSTARVPSGGRDELGRWAADFNRMADSLEATVARLEAAQQPEPPVRRGRGARAPDAAHRARRGGLADRGRRSTAMPPDARRAARAAGRRRAPAADARRRPAWRSRASTRTPSSRSLEPVDLGRLVTAVVAARLPGGGRRPARRSRSWSTPTRGGWTGSSATSSTTPATTPRARPSRSSLTPRRRRRRRRRRGPRARASRADALPHLFDRFYKADPSRGAAGSSSGLGLAIAAEHAALLGGSLRARNRPGGGLIVALTLPVTRSLPAGDRGRHDRRQIARRVPESAPRTRS